MNGNERLLPTPKDNETGLDYAMRYIIQLAKELEVPIKGKTTETMMKDIVAEIRILKGRPQ